MKMSKFKLAFAVLLIATIIWGIAFYYTLQGYREYCEWLDEQPWSEWGLRHPFWTWNGGKYVAVTGVFLLFTWIGFIIGTLGKTAARVSERKKTVLSSVFLVLAILAPIILQVGVANATWLEDLYGPTVKIGLLVCYDPEFKYGHLTTPSWVMLGAMSSLDHANMRYAENFGIEFTYDDCSDWVEWDSYESDYYYPWDLLEDAISTTGFQSGMMYNGIRRDMLLALTGKHMLIFGGFRDPDWNASIVEYNIVGSHWDEMFQHELCIFVPDCPDTDCVMNSEILSHLYPPEDWCENCFQDVNSQKFRFTVIADFNGDYKVNWKDLHALAMAYGSQKGDANWVPSCDINGDGVIGWYDLSAMSQHYGESRY